MKTFRNFLIVLLAVIGLSTVSYAQTAITINEGETLRVKCWSNGNGSQNLSLDTDCQVNLSGDEYGNNADTVIVLGTYFYMEAGNEDSQYLYYVWDDGADEYTHLIPDEGEIVEWSVSKFSQTTGYQYVGTFWVRFEEAPVTYQATFNVDFLSSSVTGATVNLTQGGTPMGSGTTSGGSCTISGLENGTYDYSITYGCADEATGTITIADGNVTKNVTLLDTQDPVPTVANLTTATAECEVTLTAPTAADNCDGTITATTGTNFPITSSMTVVWTYEDASGNAVTQNQSVVIDDVTDPTISCVGNQTRNAASNHYYSVVGTEFNPTSTNDNCSVASVSNDFNSSATLAGAQFPEGNTTVVWTVTDGDGNTNTCSFVVTVNVFTAIETLQKNKISIFPNPTNEKINIETSEKIENITVLDISGKVIIETTKNEIDLTKYELGTYILKVKTKTGIFTKTIIKE